MPTKTLKLDAIRIDGGTQIREEITTNEKTNLTPPQSMASKRKIALTRFFNTTFLKEDTETVGAIGLECTEAGFIPFIDYDRKYGWVFHSLNCLNQGGFIVKKIAARFKKSGAKNGEAAIENALAARMTARGEKHEQQVYCGTGIIDILSDVAVYEVKAKLGRNEIIRAVGQVLLYRAAVGGDRRAVIVGEFTRDTIQLIPFCHELGIDVHEFGATGLKAIYEAPPSGAEALAIFNRLAAKFEATSDRDAFRRGVARWIRETEAAEMVAA